MIYEAQVFGQTPDDELKATTSQALTCLREEFSKQNPPRGFLAGKTQMRNAIAERTGCSLLRAEKLVEELEAQGYLLYEGDTYTREQLPASWSIHARPQRESGVRLREDR